MLPTPSITLTPYSSYHVGHRGPDGLTIVWKDRNLKGPELAHALRELANEIDRRHLEEVPVSMVSPRVDKKLKAEELRKHVEAERSFFARGGVKDADGNVIQEPSE